MIANVLQNRVAERGITKAELARRVPMSADLLSRSLSGIREFRASEFLAICQELELDFSAFSVTNTAGELWNHN